MSENSIHLPYQVYKLPNAASQTLRQRLSFCKNLNLLSKGTDGDCALKGFGEQGVNGRPDRSLSRDEKEIRGRERKGRHKKCSPGVFKAWCIPDCRHSVRGSFVILLKT